MTGDEVVGRHRRLRGHEFEQSLGDGDGQGGLAGCRPWGHKESDTAERLNSNKNRQPEEGGQLAKGRNSGTASRAGSRRPPSPQSGEARGRPECLEGGPGTGPVQGHTRDPRGPHLEPPSPQDTDPPTRVRSAAFSAGEPGPQLGPGFTAPDGLNSQLHG